MTASYTFVTLQVPQAMFDFIAQHIREAGYHQAILEDSLLDMRGLALSPDPLPAIADVEWRTSKDRKAMVGSQKFMRPQPEHRNLKCLLQGPGNVPVIGIYDGNPCWKGVYPMPDILRDDEP